MTSEMNVRFLRPALLSSGRLLCTGEVVHPGRNTMIASARIVDAGQRVIAIAGCTCNLRQVSPAVAASTLRACLR